MDMLGTVHMLSTIYAPSMVPTSKLDRITNELIMKPICIKGYNENMGAVNKSDMQLTLASWNMYEKL